MMKGGFFHYTGNYRCFFTQEYNTSSNLPLKKGALQFAALLLVNNDCKRGMDPGYAPYVLPRKYVCMYSEHPVTYLFILQENTS